MHITLNWATVLLMIVIAQSFLAAFLLLFSKENRVSNRFLALLILSIALWLTDDLMRIGGIYSQQPDLYFLPIFYSFGFGPLIWFYIRSLINKNFHFRAVHLLHFFPVLVQATLYWTLSFCSYQTKLWYWIHVHRPYTYHIEFDGTWLSLIIYLLLSFRLVGQYRAWVTNNFSETSKIKLSWLRTMLIALIVLCIQWLIEIILRDGFNIYFDFDYSVELLGLLLLIMGIAGLKQANLSEITYEPADQERPEQKFEADPNILNRIVKAMEEERYYLNPTLSLAEFAAAIDLNSWIVSRNINIGLKKTFNDFVNGYRVEEVKRRLRSGDLTKFTLLSIALESGFNSKTTFNRIFKDLTGATPSVFNEK